MKKLTLIACAAMAFTALADDSYLYWMVDDTQGPIINLDGVATSYSSLNADPSYGSLTVKVVAYNSSTWRPNQTPNNGGTLLNLYGQNAMGGLVSVGNSVAISGVNSSYYANIAPGMIGENWSYFIELYNDKGTFVGRSSEGIDYASVQSGQYLMGSDREPGELWNVATFTATAAPEPSSGLLMLIGCAALALRRRKQIAA